MQSNVCVIEVPHKARDALEPLLRADSGADRAAQVTCFLGLFLPLHLGGSGFLLRASADPALSSWGLLARGVGSALGADEVPAELLLLLS